MNDSIYHNVKLRDRFLKDIYFESIDKPQWFTLEDAHSHFDYVEFSEEHIMEFLMTLVEYELLEFDGKRRYRLSRSGFLELKKKYLLRATVKGVVKMVEKDLGTSLTISATAATLVALSVALLTKTDPKISFFDDPTHPKDNVEQIVKENLNLKLKSLEDYLKNTDDTISQKQISFLDIKFSGINERISGIEKNINNINNLLEDSPKKFVEISSIKKDLDNLQKQMAMISDYHKAEIDRLSNYLIAIIAFVATFLVVNIGISIFTSKK